MEHALESLAAHDLDIAYGDDAGISGEVIAQPIQSTAARLLGTDRNHQASGAIAYSGLSPCPMSPAAFNTVENAPAFEAGFTKDRLKLVEGVTLYEDIELSAGCEIHAIYPRSSVAAA
jgi:hypothetical protein